MQLKDVSNNIHYLVIFAASVYLKYRLPSDTPKEEEVVEETQDQWKEDKVPNLRLVEPEPPEDLFVANTNIKVDLDKDASDEAELFPKAPPPPSPTKKFLRPFSKS